jgi:AcrR family transcriptional regulator
MEILRAALRVARELGVENFSMRQLAAELGSSPMSLYYYFPNRDALLERAVDQLLGRIVTPSPDARLWKDRLRLCGHQAVRELAEHAVIARFLLSGRVTPGVARLLHYLNEELLNAGFDEPAAQDCLSVYYLFLYGVIGTTAFAIGPEVSPTPEGSRKLDKHVTEEVGSFDVQRWLDFGLDLLLEGFEQRLGQNARRQLNAVPRGTGRPPNRAVHRKTR